MRCTAAAVAMLLARTQNGLAEGAETEPAPVGDAQLRLESFDLARQFRAEAGSTTTPRFSTDRPVADQDIDGGSQPDADTDPATAPDAAAADGTGDQADEGNAPLSQVPPRRPRFNLFDGPSSTPASRQNTAASAAGPILSRVNDQTGGTSSGFAEPPERSSLFDPGASTAPPTPPTAAASAAPLSANARPGAAGDLATTGLLSTAPIRPTRLEQTGSRLNLRTLPLRSPFPTPTDDPFGPIGTRLGSFILYTAVEQSFGVSNNLEGAPNGTGGAFSDTALSAVMRSDWSRHAAELEALANYRRNFAGEEPSQPDVTVNGTVRLDIDRLTTATLEGGLEYRREDDTDLDPLAGSEDQRADRLDYRASAALERSFGRAFARASVTALRETISGGGTLAGAASEDFDTFAGTVRFGYRLTPAFAPFAEVGLGKRLFDDSDVLDIERDALIETLRGGVSFDFGEKLNGEIAVGYARNRPDADALDTVASPTVDAKLNWSPVRGTDIAFTAATTFDPDPLGASTATLYEAGIAARHRATARLSFDAAFTAGYRDSELDLDVERVWGVSTGFTYWLNRSVALVGLASHRSVDRDGPGQDYNVETAKLGIKVQN